jgi:hypothetical protein
MSLALSRIAIHTLTVGSIALGLAFGPPRITVRPVTDPSKAPAGAVLLVESMHHNEIADLDVTGRAEGFANGKRVTLPLRLTHQTVGHYALTKQWQDGTPWVLVLAAEQGSNGSHGVAEAIVKVDASGAFASIDYPAAGWIAKTDTPKRTSAADIEAVLSSMVARR